MTSTPPQMRCKISVKRQPDKYCISLTQPGVPLDFRFRLCQRCAYDGAAALSDRVSNTELAEWMRRS